MNAALKLDAVAQLATHADDPQARSVIADIWYERGRPDVARLWVDRLAREESGDKRRLRKRIDKLTQKEHDAMLGWARQWIGVGLSTQPADRALFEAAVTACYRYTGLAAPRVIWCPSPIVAALAGPIAAHILRRAKRGGDGAVDDAVGGAVDDAVGDAVGGAVGGAVRGAVDDAVRGAVRGAVDDAVRGAVRGAVDGAVRGAVDDAVRDAVRGAVGGAVDDAVGGAVRGAVDDAVGGAVDDAVDDAVRDAVRGAVDGAVRGAVGGAVDDAVDDAVRGAVDDADPQVLLHSGTEWWRRFGGQFWVGGWWWGSPAFVSFFTEVARLQLERDIELCAQAYAATCSSACWWWPAHGYVFVSERPSQLIIESNKLKLAQWQGWEVRP